ncbi:GNAT family N-acetyltransferase [Lapillicoccus jejuensis]|uniref:Ribosomal protein S18 acetylase RimI-like enzyme n=1 Tax=Lapillicoccus jejuensis TaxID=402171 RepID=A0A542DX95_9MICO|nr:GNAT family N-acetyltransferase [Lapillicoccus jejuensis]TQJ07711.1 ribosomal protein S18 acetylase RimI-like enzyme [Lapillicoccus jejuensis]
MSEPPEPRVAVRRLGPDDWGAYRRIRLEMLLDAPDAFLTTHAEAAAHDEATWRSRLGSATTYLAEVSGGSAGSVTLWDGPLDGPPDEAFLVAMYVAPSARRRGVGERLVRAVLDEADRRGLARVVLEVTSSNDGARRLYERCGFTATGATTPHPRRPELHEQAMVRERRPDAAGGPGMTDPGPSCTMGA